MASGGVLGPMKVAVVGSGPSAFYSAARLLAAGVKSAGAGQAGRDVEVHMYERLPTPHGLVRYGVAPDHPEVKNVENKFAQVANDPRFHFFGNVNIVQQSQAAAQRSQPSTYDYPLATRLSLQDLLPHYTHVLLSYGCSLARPLGIPGSEAGDVTNVHAALDFVNWYNGHPAAHDEAFLQHETWRRVTLDEHMQRATIVGAGNVALDVARILLRSRSTLHNLFHADTTLKARAALRETDVPEAVLQQLSQSRINHVDIVARRGPAQVAFTNKELREMMELQDVAFCTPSAEHMRLANEQVTALERKAKGSAEEDASEAERQAAASEARVRKRLLSIVEKGSKAALGAAQTLATWSMDFFKSPSTILGGAAGRVEAIRWDEMEFERMPSTHDRDAPWSGAAGGSKIRSTGRQSETQTDLVVSSVGYKATRISESIPWDARNSVVQNQLGQVLDANGKHIKGMYVSGWLARGPVGVIASTRIDANSVVEQMLHDWSTSNGQSGLQQAKDVQTGAPAKLAESSHKVVSWNDWLRLDATEVQRGKALGKLREKVLSVEEMLRICE